MPFLRKYVKSHSPIQNDISILAGIRDRVIEIEP